MWIISIPHAPEVELASGERWLRPGAVLSIGRNHTNDVVVEGAKTVSKQHLTISVAKNGPDSSAVLDQRPALKIRDLGSKFKSFVTPVNAEEVEIDGEYSVEGLDVTLRLGKAKVDFRIYWRAMVMALSNVKIKDIQDACEQLDIKFSKEFSESTTHVVTSKINTSKCLQALVERKWIVGTPYIDAMLAVADGLCKNMSLMPHPEDKGGFLPSDDEFIKNYGSAAFLPKEGRENAFGDLEFVFFEKAQYKGLRALINAGGGKALRYESTIDKQSIAEYLGKLKRPVVVLSLEEETTALLDELIPEIGGVSMTQGDFAHVILSEGQHEVYSAKHTKPFYPVPHSNASPVVQKASVVGAGIHSAEDDAVQTQAADKNPVQSKRIGSRAVQLLASFDDDLFGGAPEMFSSQRTTRGGASQVTAKKLGSHTQPLADIDELFPSTPAVQSSQISRTASQGPLASREPSSSPEIAHTQSKRKRGTTSRPTSPELRSKRAKTQVREEDADVAFEAAPVAAAFARKRLQLAQSQGLQVPQTRPAADDAGAGHTGRPQRRKVAVEITEEEIENTLRENKRQMELQTQEANEDDVPDNDNLKNLGTVEYFQVDLPDSISPSRASRATSTRWDPKWNGRKNFKGFRRAATGSSISRPERPAIMIRLVPSEPSDRGLADQQWLETATTRNRDAASYSDTQRARGMVSARNDEVTTNREFSTIHDRGKDGRRSETTGVSNFQDPEDGVDVADVSQRVGNSFVSGAKAGGSVGRSAGRRSQQTLFMPDGSDSDDDPLKFRL